MLKKLEVEIIAFDNSFADLAEKIFKIKGGIFQ